MVEGGHDEARTATTSRGEALGNSPPLYPPAASTVPDNEAGGVVRKPGIRRVHKAQDVTFLVVFLVFCVGFIVETSFGFHNGNPLRLDHGLDYKGNVCGDRRAHPSLQHLEVLYWVNPSQLFLAGERTSPFKLTNARGICLQDCPRTAPPGQLRNGSVAWVCDYPEGAIQKNVSMREWVRRKYDYFDVLGADEKARSIKFGGPCYPVLFPSTNVFWRCQLAPFPDNQTMQLWKILNGTDVSFGPLIVKAVDRVLTSSSATLQRYIADLGRAWPVLLLFGGLVPLLFSVSWLILVCYFIRPTVWISLALLNVLALLVTLFFYVKVGWIGHDAVTAVIGSQASGSAIWASSMEQSHMKIIAVFVTLALILTVLVTVALLHRISITMKIIKVSLQSITAIPSLLIYPLIPFAVLAAFLIVWVAAALYLFSAGEVRPTLLCCGFRFHHRRHMVWAILFHFFSLYWVCHFVLAGAMTTVAGAVAAFYWAKGETAVWNGGEGSSWKGLGWLPVISTGKHVTKFSLGSMALGSLVVPPVELLRFFLQALRSKLKSAQVTMPNGTVISTHGRSGTCCLGCLDWTLARITRNAFIVIAVSGKEFCKAAEKATALVANNASRVGDVMVIGDLILFLGKLCVSFACALFAFLMLDTHRYKTSLSRVSSPLFPVLFCWGFAYVTASIFFAVGEMALDTVLLSYCIDAEENQGTALFAPAALVEGLNAFTERQEALEQARDFRKYRTYEDDHYDNDHEHDHEKKRKSRGSSSSSSSRGDDSS